MELHFWSILTIALCFAYKASGETTLETTEKVTEFQKHRVTLPCKLITTNTDDWMFIRWMRLENGTNGNLASIQNRVFSAEWSRTAPADFTERAELRKNVADGDYSLDLIIDEFLCSDVGVYTCDVFTMSSTSSIQSQTVLEVKANPGQPSIMNNLIEVNNNDTFTVECNADVGVPARTISWWYTLPEASHIYQQVTDGIKQEMTSSDACTNKAKSTLTLTMSPELDGAVYICSLTIDVGLDGKPQNADEVNIVLFGKTTTTQSTRAPSSTTKASVTTEISSANAVSLPLSAVLLSCIVTIFNLYFTRTT